METKKIVMGVISVAVAIIVLMSMIPIFTDAGASEDTFTNEGYYTLDRVTDDTEATITWSTATPKSLTVNGTTLDMTQIGSGRSYTIAGSDTFVLRYYDNNTDVFLQCFGTTYTSVISNNANTVNATITISGGTLNYYATDGINPALNVDYSIGTDCYMINPTNTGDYVAVMKLANMPAYVKGDSKITLIGTSITDYSSAIALYGVGTIDDGLTISTIYKPTSVTTVTYSEPVVTKTDISGYVGGLYSLDKYDFTITRDSSSPVAVTYSYFIVPAEITAERSVHASPVEATLIGLIPLLMMVGILLTAIGLFIAKYRKN